MAKDAHADRTPARRPGSDNAPPAAVVAQLTAKAADPPAKRSASIPKTDPVADVANFDFAGTVARPDGQPAERAKVRLIYLRKPSSDNPPASALTDEQGKFAFSIKRSLLSDALIGPSSNSGLILIAEKDGFGFASEPAADFETSGRLEAGPDQQRRRGPRAEAEKANVLKLVLDDVPVRGRLVNSEGRPIAGAKIEVVSVVTQDRPLDAWEARAKKDRIKTGPPRHVMWQFGRPLFEAYMLPETLHVEEQAGKSTRVFMPRQFRFVSQAPIVPAVRTDADGRFTFKGLGRDRIVEIVVSAPGIETTQPFLRTRRGELIQSHEPVYPSDFTLVATPTAPVTGRIVDSKTGHGLAGVRVQSTTVLFARTLSDGDGSYRLDGLPLGENRLFVIPPAGSRHLAGRVDVKTALGAAPVVRDIKLTSGVLVRGRVIDKRTGDPVRGTLNYYAIRSNPHLRDSDSLAPRSFDQEFTTDANGRFEVPALPGPGVLAFLAGPRFAFGVGRDRIGDASVRDYSPLRMVPGPRLAESVNLVVPLNPEADAKEVAVNLELSSASDVTGRVVSPEGKALTDYYVHGVRPRLPWYRNTEEEFKVVGYFPTESRRLVFYDPKGNFAGYYDLTGEPPAKLEIKLRPAATLVGRLLGTDGKPLAHAPIYSETRPLRAFGPSMGAARRRRGDLAENSPDAGILPFSGSGHPFKTDAQGRFELKGVIPGLKYTAKVEEPQSDEPQSEERMMRPRLFTVFTDLAVASAETKQLGDLTVKPDERRPGQRLRRPRSPAQLPPSD